MRLVDVEPFDFISFQMTDDTAYDQGFEDGVQYFANNLDAAPTIDAIPVEWLKAQIKPYTGDASDIGKSVRTGTIKDLIRKWQKEQEAQDDRG